MVRNRFRRYRVRRALHFESRFHDRQRQPAWRWFLSSDSEGHEWTFAAAEAHMVVYGPVERIPVFDGFHYYLHTYRGPRDGVAAYSVTSDSASARELWPNRHAGREIDDGFGYFDEYLERIERLARVRGEDVPARERTEGGKCYGDT